MPKERNYIKTYLCNKQQEKYNCTFNGKEGKFVIIMMVTIISNLSKDSSYSTQGWVEEG